MNYLILLSKFHKKNFITFYLSGAVKVNFEKIIVVKNVLRKTVKPSLVVFKVINIRF